MGKLESPNQYGSKGDQGSAPAEKGGSLVSPIETGNKGDEGSSPEPISGKLISPGYRTNSSEASGHGDGRSSKGNDGKHGTGTGRFVR